MRADGAGTIAPGERETYDFWSSSRQAAPSGADNAYMAASVKVNYAWEAVNN